MSRGYVIVCESREFQGTPAFLIDRKKAWRLGWWYDSPDLSIIKVFRSLDEAINYKRNLRYNNPQIYDVDAAIQRFVEGTLIAKRQPKKVKELPPEFKIQDGEQKSYIERCRDQDPQDYIHHRVALPKMDGDARSGIYHDWTD